MESLEDLVIFYYEGPIPDVTILLSYHHTDYFFTSTQLCVLPPSLFFVIVHSAIHAFLIS